MIKQIAVASLLALSACGTPAPVTTVPTTTGVPSVDAAVAKVNAGAAKIEPGLQTACGDVIAILGIPGVSLIPGIAQIAPFANTGCTTAEGLVKLAADPSSTEWVGQLAGQVKAIAATVGIKIAERHRVNAA